MADKETKVSQLFSNGSEFEAPVSTTPVVSQTVGGGGELANKVKEYHKEAQFQQSGDKK